MLARLDTTPEQVTADFRQRCGIAEPLAGTLDAKTLKRDLKVLRDGDARPELCRFVGPLLHLAGGGDAIVPREMAAHAFKAAQNLTQIWLPEGGHALPLSAPAWCGAEIRRFLSEHFESR
jgi:pimeloyl-ACP methyl ester carboxylesterase